MNSSNGSPGLKPADDRAKQADTDSGGGNDSQSFGSSSDSATPLLNTYTDTRGHTADPLPFSQAIITGLADGGGLYVPETLPHLAIEEIVELADAPYWQLAAHIYRLFGVDCADEQVDRLMQAAYGNSFSSPQVAPVVAVTEYTYLLELTHGPTAAFKDMALQCLPHFFSAALEAAESGGNLSDCQPDLHLILVATSGDTGSAALAGFKDREHTGIIVFYPQDGVSDVQKLQMTSAAGANVGVVAVKGNFDDCQSAVKAVLDDQRFAADLAARRVRLSSANSINWGRLLPQVVYYVSAYAQLVKQGRIQAGEPIDVCVPTGNFGNILAAWYARQIGTPLGRLYCASNENHVLADFINTGNYDIAGRQFQPTTSPSMDILVSSNLERQLYELNGHDAGLIRQWMESLRTERRFEVDQATWAALQDCFKADWVSNDESLAVIAEVFAEHGYLLDPHTAVAWKAAERLRPTADTPVLVVSAAHWAKFAADVYRALTGLPAGATLPTEAADLSGAQLIGLIQSKYAAGAIPSSLQGLDERQARFQETTAGTREGIEQSVLAWLDSHGC